MPESKKPSRKRLERKRISKCIFLFEKWEGKKRCGKKQRWCVDDGRKERKREREGKSEIYSSPPVRPTKKKKKKL